MYAASQVVISADLSDSSPTRPSEVVIAKHLLALHSSDCGTTRRVLEIQIRSGNILKPRRRTRGAGRYEAGRRVVFVRQGRATLEANSLRYCSSSSATMASPSVTQQPWQFPFVGGVLENTGAPKASRKRFVRVAEHRAVRNFRNFADDVPCGLFRVTRKAS